MLNLENKKILIYGFGKSGKSSFNFLRKKNLVKIFDDNQNTISIYNKNNFIKKNKIYLSNFDYIVISPGINIAKSSIKNYLNKNRQKIITDLDIFYSHYKKNKKITITGTNGKSTTAKLVYDILKYSKYDVRLTGNIGKPVLNEKNITKATIFVIEASSYQLEYSNFFVSDISAIINISPDHLERHLTFSNYVQSKFKLIKSQNSKGISLIEANNKHIKKFAQNKNIKGKIIRIKKFINSKFLNKIQNPYFQIKNNIQNLNFALEICKLFKIKIYKIIKPTNNFAPLKYRQQIKINNKKLIIINDSKSTSFSSSIPLLETYSNIYWIVGGLPKKGDLFSLNKKYFKNIKAYIVGKHINFFKKKFINKINYIEAKTIQNALKKIMQEKYKGVPKTIIFSPAAASFDQFSNFEDRGSRFDNLLKKFFKK